VCRCASANTRSKDETKERERRAVDDMLAGAPNAEDLTEPYMPSTAVSTRHAMAEYGNRPYHVRPFDLQNFGPTVRYGTRTITAVQPSCTVTVRNPTPNVTGRLRSGLRCAAQHRQL
jgi:hypothetical protein